MSNVITHRILAHEGERVLITWTYEDNGKYRTLDQEVTIPPRPTRAARTANKNVFRATEDQK